MTMTLKGPSEIFDCTVFDWAALLDLAIAFGWKPLGTVVDADELHDFPGGIWNGGYHTNDNQMVLESDAAELAAALEKALESISDQDLLHDIRNPALGLPQLAPPLRSFEPREWLSGEDARPFVRSFISFCRKGGFRIC